MSRVFLIPLLLLVASLLAGTYGALHNQISYSVSREYFTEFKFRQFRIPNNVSERVGASIVGWNASWWMGFTLGLILLPIGLVIRRAKAYFWAMLSVFCVVTVTTLLCGVLALLASFCLIDADLANVHTSHHGVSKIASRLLELAGCTIAVTAAA